MVIFHSYVGLPEGMWLSCFIQTPFKHHEKKGVIISVNLKKGVEATNLDELEFSRDDSNQYSFAKRSQ